MKVAFCLGSLNKGGAERVVCNLSNYLVGKKIEVYIIVTKLAKKEYYLKDEVKVFSLDGEKNSNVLINNWKRMKKIEEIVCNNDIDIILGFLQEPIARLLFMKTFFKKMKKVPLIISMRIDPKTAFNTFKRRMSLFLYNNANGYVFQTVDAKMFFNKKIQNKSAVIANSIDPIFYEKNKSKRNVEKKIVSVGRLTNQKNYPLLIDGFAEIEKKHPEFSLEIYGEGPLKNELMDYISKKGLQKKVKLMGNVQDVYDKIYNASMFVITSDYEGMSNALMEAMALGIPSISTDSSGGGASTLIKNGINGVLIPTKSCDDLAKKMEFLINNPEISEEIGIESKKSMEKYRPEIINELWLNYIGNVLDKGE